MVAIGIQSTFNPPDRPSPHDWMLYLKVRSMRKVELVRALNNRLNQVLSQNITKNNS